MSGALDKLDEEVRELRQAALSGTGVAEEVGDVLFAAVKAARFAGVDPEEAIAATCEKFIRRFRAVEEGAARQGRSLDELSLEEMTSFWDGAKRS
jgi:tetrapyrrole methylase family protein/MazG family protein